MREKRLFGITFTGVFASFTRFQPGLKSNVLSYTVVDNLAGWMHDLPCTLLKQSNGHCYTLQILSSLNRLRFAWKTVKQMAIYNSNKLLSSTHYRYTKIVQRNELFASDGMFRPVPEIWLRTT